MAIDYLGTVKKARAQFADQPASARRGWQITNQTVLLLHAQGETFWGLFSKTSGTNWNGYSLDIVMHQDGHTYDCLQDAEGKAVPQWGPTQPTGMGDPAKWRAPVGTPVTPEPGPEPPTSGYVTEAEFAAYKHQVDERFKALRDELLMMILDLTARVSKLEDADGTVTTTAYMLVSDPNAPPISTSRQFAHDHELRAAVVPKAKA